ncbi:MAG: DUF72 domain-containing protein [Actinobacteria bacterium]|nr:DUF72 domain-containing protein [Actinomycetota bacterium]
MSPVNISKIYIGTSGWSYDEWNGIFYPEDLKRSNWFSYYSKHFRTVEINNSFYHLPKRQTFENWAEKTPDDFLFSVKASRYITHIKRLLDCSEALDRLFKAAEGLGRKLGIFLFQLPPNMKFNIERLNNFFKILRDIYTNYANNANNNALCAFEFREESWFCESTYDLLNEYKHGIVISDSPCFPYHELITGNFCYIRMHGSSNLYSSSYSEEELKKAAGIINKNKTKNISSYVYFNNDVHGYAIDNAKTLIRMVS